jgi:hypothetical protein
MHKARHSAEAQKSPVGAVNFMGVDVVPDGSGTPVAGGIESVAVDPCRKEYTLPDSGSRQQFDTGAHRDIQQGKGRYDLLPPFAIQRVAIHFEDGALKYNDRNWEKGIPLTRFYDSAKRHLDKHAQGEDSEDHLAAAAWNIMCMMDTEERIAKGILPSSLDDRPEYWSRYRNSER